MSGRKRESWNTRMGVILAVSGSAVGLGNFLRFPGQAAEYGGGAFMIAYFMAFIFLGLPICWAEWAMGRRGGQMGFNSCPAIFTVITRHPQAKYLGIIGVLVPVIIYMYYVNIEAWCLGYAVNFLAGTMHFSTPQEAGTFFYKFIGVSENGSALGFALDQVGLYLLIVFLINFILIYRGLSKGIEWFCTYAMPTLVVLAVVILVRVLTLAPPDPVNYPERNVLNGLGFMWNPTKQVVQQRSPTEDEAAAQWVKKYEVVGQQEIEAARLEVSSNPELRLVTVTVWDQLLRPQLWLAAAGQIFFSLSIGFGVILTYASYLKKDDDIVLSGLAASSANEFCEVALGGLISLPAAVAFLGAAGMAGMGSTFALGFNVLPMVFANMPAGQLFGFLFFFLLFLAAVTSSLSMLQPGIAFLEEALFINRRQSVAVLAFITAVGSVFVLYFSQDLKALDTLDFWVGTFMIYFLAMLQILLFGWVLGIDKGFEEAHRGARLRIPPVFRIIMKYVTPLFLFAIFAAWISRDVLGIGSNSYSAYITDLFIEPDKVAWMSIGLVILAGAFTALILAGSYLFQRLARDSKEQLP